MEGLRHRREGLTHGRRDAPPAVPFRTGGAVRSSPKVKNTIIFVKVETVTTALDLLGVFANALLGGAVARNHRLDLFGFVVIGLVSGLGGGLIRDVLLNTVPVALTNSAYIPVALLGAGLAFVLRISERDWNRMFTWVDAAALSLWAAVGAQKSLAFGLGWLPAILLGTVTAVGGGACRDLLTLRIPTVLGGNALYASVAVLVAAVQVAFTELGTPLTGTVLGILAGAVLRIVAAWRHWNLPNGLEWEPRALFGKIPRPPYQRRRRRRRRPSDEPG